MELFLRDPVFFLETVFFLREAAFFLDPVFLRDPVFFRDEPFLELFLRDPLFSRLAFFPACFAVIPSFIRDRRRACHFLIPVGALPRFAASAFFCAGLRDRERAIFFLKKTFLLVLLFFFYYHFIESIQRGSSIFTLKMLFATFVFCAPGFPVPEKVVAREPVPHLHVNCPKRKKKEVKNSSSYVL